jgi:hypothetical protein
MGSKHAALRSNCKTALLPDKPAAGVVKTKTHLLALRARIRGHSGRYKNGRVSKWGSTLNAKRSSLIIMLLMIILMIFAIASGVPTGFSWEHYVVIGISLVSLTAAFFMQRDVAPEEGELQEQQGLLHQEEKTLKTDQAELEELRKAIETQLEHRAKQLDGREVALDDRLIAYHEWMEYPQPQQELGQAANQPETRLAEKDQQVLDLLETEAKQLYERIKSGYYKQTSTKNAQEEGQKTQSGDDGKLNLNRVRDDAHALVLAVARVYQPDVEDPLLETNVSDVLRAASRTCLHLLIVLERLPLGLHDKSLGSIYSYIQKAVKAYDVYQAASPYLGYATRAFNVGRFAIGANPLAVGLTWALSEFGKKGAKKLTTKFVDQQAVGVLHDLVRVIGFEVASIYSGDFRHRDPNWVFASELTQLMSQFPVSRESLSRSLREIGSLQLRNEYDRVYLYRCLSTHRSADPLQDATAVLPTEDCQNVVKRLENFYRSFMHGRTERRTEGWRKGVEERLGVKLTIPTRQPAGDGTVNHDLLEVCESLVGFLIGVKGLKPALAINGLTSCEIAKRAGSDEMHSIVRQIEEQPPHVFDPPDIDVDSELLDQYLSDLARLSVHTKPWDVQVDDVVVETAAYFGKELMESRKQLDSVYVEFASSMLAANAPTKLEAGPIRAALAHLEGEELIRFAYSSGKLGRAIKQTETASVIGTTSRLLIVTPPEENGVLVECDLQDAQIAKVDGILIDDLKISHPAWRVPFSDQTQSASITLAKPMISRFDTWFQPLLDLK